MKANLKALFARGFGLVCAVGLVVASGATASAQTPARNANWDMSLTYQNVSSSPSKLMINFYKENSTETLTLFADQLPASNPLQPGAATSLFVGSLRNPGFIRGNAVLLSEQPLVATAVQFATNSGYKMRLLSNGFSTNKYATQYMVATTLLNRFSRTTVFSIQNTADTTNAVTIKFYDADNGGQLANGSNGITFNIPANSSKFIEMDNRDHTGLGDRLIFNGSAIISANANIVASAVEYYLDRPVATAFEGMPLADAGNRLYMATALCQRFGLDTYYAIQNASLTTGASVTIRYFDLAGGQKAVDGPRSIGQGGKYSASTCAPSDGTAMANFTGSAVIEATGAPIVAIGKAQVQASDPNNPAYKDVLTSFLGEKQGYQKVALPYVRWANNERYNASTGQQQRAYITIQNVSDTEANGVIIQYNDKNGATVATQIANIPAKAKFNTDPSIAGALGQNGMNAGEFGYYTDGTYGGGVIIEAPTNYRLIAIARLQHPGAGEDYNAVPIP